MQEPSAVWRSLAELFMSHPDRAKEAPPKRTGAKPMLQSVHRERNFSMLKVHSVGLRTAKHKDASIH